MHHYRSIAAIMLLAVLASLAGSVPVQARPGLKGPAAATAPAFHINRLDMLEEINGGFHWFHAENPAQTVNNSFEGQIAYVGVDGNVYLVRGDTGQSIQLTFDANSSEEYFSPKFSRDGKYLVFSRLAVPDDYSYYFFSGPLFLVDTTSYQISPLVENGSQYEWMPDWYQIAYIQDFSLYTIDLSGMKPTLILDDVDDFSVSPNGNPIAISKASDADGCNTGPIFLFDLPSRNIVRQLSGGQGYGWSPDGQWFVITEGCPEYFGRSVWNSLTGDLAIRASENFYALTWSPDSTVFAGSLSRFFTEKDAVLLQKPDGTLVGEIPIFYGVLLWSPDGKWIAAANETGENIVLIDPISLAIQEINDSAYKTPLIWSPSGKQLLISDMDYSQDDSPAELSLYDIDSKTILFQGNFDHSETYQADAAWGVLPESVEGNYTLSGNVHLTDQSPLPGVSILMDGVPVTTTDANGNFQIGEVEAGSHTIEPRLEGYIFSPKIESRNIQNDAETLSFLAQESADIILKAIEVTQVVQDLDNNLPLVAGKQTIVRLYFQSNARVVTDFEAVLVAKRPDGSRLVNSPLSADNFSFEVTSKTLDEMRADINATLNFRLPPEWLTGGEVILSVEQLTNAFGCEMPGCQVSVNFQSVPQPELRFFLVSTEGRTPVENAIRGVKNEIIAEFPISGIQSGPGDEWSLWMQPLFYDAFSVYNRLLLQRTLDNCTISCQKIYIGILDDKPGEDWGGISSSRLQGAAVGYWIPTDSRALPILPHELAHAYGRPHTPFCGAENNDFTDDYPQYPNGSISRVLFGSEAIFGARFTDPSNPIEIFNPSNSFDLMTYCYQDEQYSGGLWPSDYTYKKLLEQIQQRYAQINQPEIAFVSYKVSENPEAFVISGWYDPQTNTISLNSTYVAPVTPHPIQSEGLYQLRIYDALNAVLLETSFTPELYGTDGKGMFVLAVPNPQNPARITITSGDQLLYEKAASANRPEVALLSPNGGDSWSGEKATIVWTASDADHDQLHYAIQYSKDAGQSWETLGADITDQQLEIPLKFIPGSSQALIRVLASDGFFTAADLSDATFSVAGHVPEVNITFPKNLQSYPQNQLILLQGEAYDAEDGQLSNLAWIADNSKPIGNGNFISLPASQLTPGRHTIALTATDLDGNVSSASIQVSVEGSANPGQQDGPESDSFLQILQAWALPVLLFLGALGIAGFGTAAYLYFRPRKKKNTPKRNGKETLPQQRETQINRLNTQPGTGLSHPVQAKPTASEDLQQAQILLKAGNCQDAFPLLRRIVQVEPDNAQAWLILGYTLGNLNDKASAERCLLRAKKLGHPKAEQALEWLGTSKKA